MSRRFEKLGLSAFIALVACLAHALPQRASADVFSDLAADLESISGGATVSANPVGERVVPENVGIQVPNRPGYWNDFDPYLAVQRSAPAVGVTSEEPRSVDSPFTKDELKEVEVLIVQLKRVQTNACHAKQPVALESVASEIDRLRPGLEATHSAAEASLSDVVRERQVNEAKLREIDVAHSPLREELANKANALAFDAVDLQERSQRASAALGALRELSARAASCDSTTPSALSDLRPHRPASGNYGKVGKSGAIPSHDLLPRLKEMKGSLRP